MTVLPAVDIFEKFVSNTRDRVFSDVNSIFYNENNTILISANYLDFLESTITDENFEHVKSLVIELSDSERIIGDIVDNDHENIYEQLYNDNCDTIDCLFAITLGKDLNIDHYKYSEQDEATKNKEFLIFELLRSSSISFHHYNFNSNLEIQNLIKRVFSLPKKLSRVLIYNRYSEHNYFGFLNNKSIHYFNLIIGNTHKRKTEYIRIEADLKASLGRNIVLKTTNDLNNLHERKIFFNHFFLTFDQAFDNLVVTERNWKIDIHVDKKVCFNEWIKKNRFFAKLV